MTIRKVKIEDVNDIVSIHCSAFKGFFLTSLGPQFLKLYYTCFIKSNETITMVAEDEGRILGFSASTRSEERRVGKECRSRWSPYH